MACETSWVRRVVVVYIVCIEQLAGVVNIVSDLLQPNGQVRRVEALFDKFRITAVRWVDVCDVRVVCSFAREECDARGTADSGRAVVLIVICPFLDQMLSHQWHVIKR